MAVTRRIFRHGAAIGVVALATGLLTGCTLSGANTMARPTVSPAESAALARQEDQTARLYLEALYPEVELPEVPVIRFVTAVELPHFMAKCLASQGVEDANVYSTSVTLEDGGAVLLHDGVEVTHEELVDLLDREVHIVIFDREPDEKYDVANYTCRRMFPLDPRAR
ncbi:hypothetical protein [Salinibacterium sp. M195]|uniref:hypothetical protein n=1 Tax=Salinibacterium sp. M195 TaxID=2583374 RepID=UPI001C62ECD8|nr:hypothetical protein [Salinibacterium sp. M195]QYH34816.1 hypothetical protein FFT87_01990 [Salinibacterium sp. M195]